MRYCVCKYNFSSKILNDFQLKKKKNYLCTYIYTSGLRPLLAPLANPRIFALALVKV